MNNDRRIAAASGLGENFATGPDDPLNNCHKFYCVICRVNVSMRARGVYETKRQNQSLNHSPLYQRSREK